MPELPGASLPLSAAQAGIWFAQALDRANPIYNTSEYVEIHGPMSHGLNAPVSRRPGIDR